MVDSLRQLRAVEAEVAGLFPTHAPTPSEAGTSDTLPGAALPCIPGYSVLRELGRGGMGVVYMARHQKLDRVVAVKMLLSGGFASPAEQSRFLREAQALAGLRHPHIVQVYDTGDLDGRPYFTMEYVDGGSLSQALSHALPAASRAAHLVATLAEAVQVAHIGGIIHRDLKPANILLTSDGTPKISDFGLARWYERGPDLTLRGARLGTPSYMSPEQSIGREGTVGPPTDIYSLGAVLYEMLTGRPPFLGDSPGDTERQLLYDDPTPARRLNGLVPADLDVISLKCLHKSPAARYASAQALADDLRRYLSGRPISARPTGLAERTAKWARRSPAKATMLSLGVVGALAAGGTLLWALSARAARIAEVEADLSATVQHQRRGEWDEARSSLDRAAIRIGSHGPSDLQDRINRSQSELMLVDRLDAVRLLRAGSEDGTLNDRRATGEYAHAFQSSGLGTISDEPDSVAARIVGSEIAPVLIGALDDWRLASSDPRERSWLGAVVGLADRAVDPHGWRCSAREAMLSGEGDSLLAVAGTAPVREQPVTFLYAFAEAMNASGVDSLPFLFRAQAAHPDDFWLASSMANSLKRHGRHAEAVGYYRAALALRPDTMAAHYNLGRALGTLGLHDEAIGCFRAALECDPGAIDPLKSMGLTFANAGRHEDALKCYLAALPHDETDALLRRELAWTYANLGMHEQAADSYLRSLELSPGEWSDAWGTRAYLLKCGRHHLAASMWRSELQRTPNTLTHWDGYAELCLFNEDTASYEVACRELLERFGDATDPNECERIGRACVLAPAAHPEQLTRAAALIDRALAAPATRDSWAFPYFRFARALADYRAGNFAAAATIVEGESAGVLGPAPGLVAAMCRAKMGEHAIARQHLADAVVGFDWTMSAANNREAWIYHILRREAEILVLPDLVALVRGDSVPVDDHSRRALLGACHSSERFARCAQLWSEVLPSRTPAPEQWVDPAARALVLAASGAGTDAPHFSEADRTAWRDLALALLSGRLRTLEEIGGSDSRSKDAARRVIRGWESAPELRSVREADLTGTMPEPERARWSAFWTRAKAAVGPPDPSRP
ncbi:MAG: serine/threonine-protein kinase [Planctomycetota bacterium]|nr:serine/threonine-protein kinase [Planctomycetota bacterium]